MSESPIAPYFANLAAWPWLSVSVLVCAVAIYAISMRRRALAIFASLRVQGFLAPFVSWPRQYLRVALVTSAAMAVAVALLGPRWGVYFEEAHVKQLDLMICLDVSRSMLAEDAGMSRLDRAKDDINRLLDRMAGASVGLVTFAGKAQLVCPLTDDYEFYRLELEDVGPHSAPLGGTNIGEALIAARRSFGPPAARERAIVLITDGEDQGGTATDEARAAFEDHNIRVFAIGIGDDRDGAFIPIENDGMRSLLSYRGEPVRTKLNPEKLQAIARAGGGEFHPSGQVTSRERTLEWIYRNRLLPRLKENETEQQAEKLYDRAHWFAIAALALLLIETMLDDRRSTPLETEIGGSIT